MSKYNLYRLGWKNFEDLCGHIMQSVLGQTYTPFAEGRDGGRDGFFEGTGNPLIGDQSLSGKFVFQCKFTSKGNNSITIKKLQSEIPKIRKLVQKNEIQHYIIFTNYKLSAQNDLEIKESFLNIKGLQSCLILGNEWIEMTLDKNKNLRKLVPRLYGIGDLSEILDERVYQQSLDVIEELKENVTTFVVTYSYRKAIEAINNNRFVILLGQPASGKTAIATNIAMTSLIEDNLTETLILENPTQFKNHWNPHNPKQLFWFDDVFGATNLDETVAMEWQRTFPKLRAAINKGAKVIFTSRDYIFNEARNKFKETSFPLLFNSQVVINVERLNLREKQQILYNHIKSGDLQRATKSKLKPYLSDISQNPNFTPELARRLGNRFFHKNLKLTKLSLGKFILNPSDFFEEVINNLEKDKQAAMVLILIHNNHLSSPVQDSHIDEYFKNAYNISLSSIRDALETLKNSLVKLNVVSKEKYWSLYHPSMLDSLHIMLSKKEEMLELYIVTVDVDTLVRDTTFKESSDKIFIPYNLWHDVSQRITTFIRQKVGSQEKVTRYLLNEANEDYLKWLWVHNKNILKSLSYPSFYQLRYISTYRLVSRLKELGLLEKEWIWSLRLDIYNISIDDFDLSFLEDKYIMNILDEKTKNDIIDELLIMNSEDVYDEFDTLMDDLDDSLDNDEVYEHFEHWFFTINYLVKVLENTAFQDKAEEFKKVICTVEKEINELDYDLSDSNENITSAYINHKEINFNRNDDIFSDVDK